MSDGALTDNTACSLARKLGFWSAVIAALSFVIYTICFVVILSTSPLFAWTTLADYVAYAEAYGGPFQPLAQLAMLLFGLSLVVLTNSVHSWVSPDRRILTRISSSFASLFAVTIGIHYFTQLSAVRLSLLAGETEGLQLVVQANPHSFSSAINMLGWSVFLGLSSLFLAPVFSSTGLERLIRASLLLNAVFCLGGGAGYALAIEWLVFVTTTLGMGGAVLVATMALAVWFRRRL